MLRFFYIKIVWLSLSKPKKMPFMLIRANA